MYRYLAAALLGAGTLFVVPEALAASCPGNLIAVKPLLWGDGARLGEVQAYYNPATGRNCARVVHGGETWGQPRRTSIQIETCPRAAFLANGRKCPTPGSPLRHKEGVTTYTSRTVSLPGAGRCIDVVGYIERFPARRVSTGSRIVGFCGG